MKQDEPFLVNYTVAKATMDCDFTAPLMPIRRASTYANDKVVLDPVTGLPIWEMVMDVPMMYIEEKDADGNTVVDEATGQPKMVPVPDPDKEPSSLMEPSYNLKYLRVSDLAEIGKEEYNAAITVGDDASVIQVAYIGCTYHCG